MYQRHAAHPIDRRFLERWSPRAFDGQRMPLDDLLTMLEAARWAPSAFNLQPWRFVYALRDDGAWNDLLDLLIPWNREWAAGASAILYILSDSIAETKWGGEEPSHSHSFDAGAAWACLALQAATMGYQAHGMSGIDFDRARNVLNLPERFRIEAAVVIGRPGDPANLPDKLRAREFPSDRKPLEEIVFQGSFVSR